MTKRQGRDVALRAPARACLCGDENGRGVREKLVVRKGEESCHVRR